MIYSDVKMKNILSDDDFVSFCKKKYWKMMMIFTIIIAVIIALWVIFWFFGNEIITISNKKIVTTIGALALVLTAYPGIRTIQLFGDAWVWGMTILLDDTKDLSSWTKFAENGTTISETVIFPKQLQLENKEIIEICLDSKEIRCKDKDTNEMSIMFLRKPLKKTIILKQDESLLENEMILDCGGERLIAYVKKC